jgi:hypothetical protein
MLARLPQAELEEILSGPRKGESIAAWLRREDEAALAKYPDRQLTRPRPTDGPAADNPKAALEQCLLLPCSIWMRLAIAAEILERWPPSEAELSEYRRKYPHWPSEFQAVIESKTPGGK